ncbi:hypothetical protein EJB05_02859, partial [Eragrostis curvula]
MQEEVVRMIRRFLYKDPTMPFQGKMEDAFDITRERIRRIKNREKIEWKDTTCYLDFFGFSVFATHKTKLL